jgi:hypothetical protein
VSRGWLANHPLSLPSSTWIGMTDKSFFTAGEVWKGGGYELSSRRL